MVNWLGWLVNVYPSHKNEPKNLFTYSRLFGESTWNHQLDLFFDPIFQAAISSPPKEDLPAATEVVAESEAAA